MSQRAGRESIVKPRAFGAPLVAALALAAGAPGLTAWAQHADAPAAQPAPAPATAPAPAAQPATPGAPGTTMVQPQIVQPEVKREPPPLATDPGTINLGFMEPETSMTGKSKLTNTGDTDMKLLRATTSCSCTVATDVTNKVLKPGESIEIEATLKGGKFPGPQQKAVRVFVDGYAVPVQIWVTGEVAYGVKSTPVYVDAFQTRTGEVAFESTDGKAFKIVSVNSDTPPYVGFDPEKDEARNKYTLKYDFQGIEDPKLPRWWLVETDHPKAAVIDLRVINPALIPQQDPKAPWNLMEDRSLVGALKVGESKEVHITLRPVSPPAADAAAPTFTVGNEAIKVEYVSAENGAEGYVIKAKVTAVKPLSGGTLLNERVKISWLGHEGQYDLFGRVLDGQKAAMKNNGPIME